MDQEKTMFWLKKAWRFLWEDDSIWSWLANIVVAFILIKFVVYPGLGLFLATSHPIVAVVSGSMHHSGSFDAFWQQQGGWYEKLGIAKEEFDGFPFANGFNKGDIMILFGYRKSTLRVGDVIVFGADGRDPIIHRIVNIRDDSSGEAGARLHWTKGDNNPDSIRGLFIDETNIKEGQIIGRAVVRIPYLGYIKIGFVELLRLLGG